LTIGMSPEAFWDASPAQVGFYVDQWIKAHSPKPKQRKGGAAELMAIFGTGGARMHNLPGALDVPAEEASA
jgi:hypothetical protein